ELEADEGLAAEHLRVVARFDHVDLAGGELDDGSVVVRHPHPAGLDHSDVSELTRVRTGDGLDAVRPAPAGLERQSRRGRPAEVDDVRPRLGGSPGLVGGDEITLLDT